jgi:SPP1 gp7 family putative phage head morphogenesis protein|nr:MAG TPA: minor capsid protein [Caudoviricetes sp.]
MAQKKRKLAYWERRDIDAEQKINDGAIKVEEAVTKAYRQAQTYLTQKVRKLFARSQQRSGLSEDEAKRILNQTTSVEELAELRKLSKQIKNPELQASAKNRLQALAFKERITRAEDLKAKSFLVSKHVADVQLEKQTEFYVDAIHETYREATAESVIRKAQENAKNGVVIEVWNKKDYQFKELSTRYTKNILDSHWHGSNYSKRLWGDTEALAARLEELFTVESMTGMSEFEMAKAIASEFDRSIGVARRLIRTEANYMANQAKLKAWQDNGVKEYMLVAVLDLRTSEICRGKDHKVYLVSEAVVNGASGTYPPFHPWCRTIAVMYSKRTLKLPRNALDPISGKVIPIKGETTYNDWMNKLKEKYSDEEIALQQKKIKNAAKDNAEYRNLKNVLGDKNTPSTLDKYQNIKYNKGNEWEELKDHYFVKSRLKDGRYGSVINAEKQAPHMKSTAKAGKSYFNDDVDVQGLFDKYAGTGVVETNKNGRMNKEKIMTDSFLGFDYRSGLEVKGFKIHHSANRTHLVPWKGES